MEELDLQELLRYYLRKLPIILGVLILTIVAGYLYIKSFQVPLYHGTTTIILIQKQDEGTNDITQSELTISEKLVSTYTEIIKSRRVLSPVIQTLNLDMTTDELKNKISVSSVNDTSIIKITVSDENNYLAVSIANNLATVFKEEISKIYNLENISTIDEAIAEKTPYNVNVTKQLIVYSLISVVLTCVVIFVMFYFDDNIKSKKEVESKLNLPVLGEIPMVKK